MQDAGLVGQGWLFGRPEFFGKTAPNTRRNRVAAPADLEHPKGLGFEFGFGYGLGLRSGWSGLACKFEIADTRHAQSFVPIGPADNQSPKN